MGYIYKISNDINNKVYIGATNDSVEERWRQHIRDYKRVLTKPLYKAMRDLGIEVFSYETLLETEDPFNFEQSYIDKYDSIVNGYNSIGGGLGRPTIDRLKVLELYKECSNAAEVSRKLSIDPKSVKRIIESNGLEINRSNNGSSKAITIVDLNKHFKSIKECAEYLKAENIAKATSSIDSITRGIRKSLSNGSKYLKLTFRI